MTRFRCPSRPESREVGLRGRKPLLIVGATAAIIVVGAFILRALSEIEVDHVLDTHRTSRGILASRAGAVAAGVATLLCIVAVFVAKWWHQRQERKFEEFLRERSSPANTEEEKSAGTGS